MMKLTKLQRHTAYIIMLAESERPWEQVKFAACFFGFCDMITYLFGDGIKLTDFKELIKNKPEGTELLWFNCHRTGWKKRIKLLKQCIEETLLVK